MDSKEPDLPDGWVVKESRSNPGKRYYFHTETKESQWEKPETKRQRKDEEKVQVLHLLKKHEESRNPKSWRQDPITCSKEDAIAELAALRRRIADAGEGKEREELFRRLASEESDCSR